MTLNLRKTTLMLSLGALSVCCSWLGSASAAHAEWVFCANENGFCATPFTTTVHYGANGVWAERQVGQGGISCNNSAFGDPLVGKEKYCEYSDD